MVKTLTADIERLQEMITALDTLKLAYSIQNMYLPIASVKELFTENDREYDGAKPSLTTAYEGLVTGYTLTENTVIPVWIVRLKSSN